VLWKYFWLSGRSATQSIEKPLQGRLQLERGPLEADEFAGVHDVAGIEGVLHPAHQLDLDCRFVVSDLVACANARATGWSGFCWQ
jgi:hypothetical protein